MTDWELCGINLCSFVESSSRQSLIAMKPSRRGAAEEALNIQIDIQCLEARRGSTKCRQLKASGVNGGIMLYLRPRAPAPPWAAWWPRRRRRGSRWPWWRWWTAKWEVWAWLISRLQLLFKFKLGFRRELDNSDLVTWCSYLGSVCSCCLLMQLISYPWEPKMYLHK